jgi:hypothetical protein
MNKLITDINGRFPFVLDDLRWMSAGIENAISNALKAFGDNFILWGCEVTGSAQTSFNVAEGAMVLGGEVCYCPIQTLVAGMSIDEYYFVAATDYDPAGLKIFGDNSQHNTYQIREAKLQYFANAPIMPFICINDLPKPTMALQIVSMIKDTLKNQNEGWHYVGGSGEPDTTFLDFKDSTNPGKIRFRKDVFGNVYIESYVLHPVFGNFSGTVFTLPEGYRPDRILKFWANATQTVTINPSGNLVADNIAPDLILNICFKSA